MTTVETGASERAANERVAGTDSEPADTVADRMTSSSASDAPGVALAVDDVSRRLGDRNVVDHVSFDVADGELMVLIGPSGCGKSTLLRIIAGLDAAATGRIELDGSDVTALPPERRRIGLVFQDHALFPHRSVEQNVAFGLRHLSRRARARRVDEVLELVRLPGVGKR